MFYVIKADIADPTATRFSFRSQKTMYGGKAIKENDEIFLFASETQGLIARGVVTSANPTASKRVNPTVRVTPRVSVEIRRVAKVKRPLGKDDLKPFIDWKDGKPQTELNFKFYRQATNKICGISDAAADYLKTFF